MHWKGTSSTASEQFVYKRLAGFKNCSRERVATAFFCSVAGRETGQCLDK